MCYLNWLKKQKQTCIAQTASFIWNHLKVSKQQSVIWYDHVTPEYNYVLSIHKVVNDCQVSA